MTRDGGVHKRILVASREKLLRTIVELVVDETSNTDELGPGSICIDQVSASVLNGYWFCLYDVGSKSRQEL
jgi:hypothetical protein